jgi:hypothetical protein
MVRTRLLANPMPGGGKRFRILTGTIIADETQAENWLAPRRSSKCEDEVNRRSSDNSLVITHVNRDWEPLNGRRDTSPTTYRIYTQYYPTWAYNTIAHEPISSFIPGVSAVALATIARSNPSRPDISVPNFLFELKDLPGMIRDLGRLRIQGRNILTRGAQRIHPKLIANHYLSYQMGWKPLISDLQKLLSFQELVDKKMRTLEGLYRNGGIQRRVRLPDWTYSTTTEDSSVTVESQSGILFNCKRVKTSTIERWGTVRWYPEKLPDSRFSQADLQKLARDLTFGMKGISAKQVWDAIPWTWLVGWFTNVDDFLQAHDNRIPLKHSTPCVMTHRVTTDLYTRIPGQNSDFTGGQGKTVLETKERTTSTGALAAAFPFLNGRMLSILGALAIQRKR